MYTQDLFEHVTCSNRSFSPVAVTMDALRAAGNSRVAATEQAAPEQLMSQTKNTTRVDATVTIVHDGGSETISGFAHLEENLLPDGNTQIHVWYNEHSGEPDTEYDHGNIVAITAGGTDV